MKEEKKKTKKFNKKYLAFGILGLFVVALVSAGLVSYLSKTVTSDINVKSPILMEIYDGSNYVEGGVATLSSFGGETQTYYVKTTNQANVKIFGGISTIITNPDGVTCGDFNSLEMTTTIGTDVYGPEDVLGLCSPIHSQKVSVIIPNGYAGDTKPNWEAGEVDITQVDVSFKSNALGEYSFATEIIPA